MDPTPSAEPMGLHIVPRVRPGFLLGLFLSAALAATACSAADPPRDPQSPTSPRSPALVAPPSSAAPAAPTVPATPAQPPELLPDLSSLPAEDVHIEVDGAGTRVLRFAAVLANTGTGPLVVARDDSPPCPAEQRPVAQVTYVDADADGIYTAATDTERIGTPAGCMLDHPTHDHWHFDASARYVLTAVGRREPLVAADKVSFCLRDSRPLPDTVSVETYGDCTVDAVQGISPGWGDVYRSDLDGQALPLPAELPDGRYCLTLAADPFGLLRESDDENNASTIGVQLAGTVATAGPADGCVAPSG